MLCMGLHIPRGLTFSAASELIDLNKGLQQTAPPNGIQIQLAQAWNVSIAPGDTSDSVSWALWQAFSENPKLPIPKKLQKLAFGRVIEQQGCLSRLIRFFFIACLFLGAVIGCIVWWSLSR